MLEADGVALVGVVAVSAAIVGCIMMANAAHHAAMQIVQREGFNRKVQDFCLTLIVTYASSVPRMQLCLMFGCSCVSVNV
jgi:hypothetical protein